MTTADIYALQFKMRRNPHKFKWTKAFCKSAGKDIVADSTLTFAASRTFLCDIFGSWWRRRSKRWSRSAKSGRSVSGSFTRSIWRQGMPAGGKQEAGRGERTPTAEDDASERKALEEAN
jgi:large subunit ribosomal protein L24e